MDELDPEGIPNGSGSRCWEKAFVRYGTSGTGKLSPSELQFALDDSYPSISDVGLKKLVEFRRGSLDASHDGRSSGLNEHPAIEEQSKFVMVGCVGLPWWACGITVTRRARPSLC